MLPLVACVTIEPDGLGKAGAGPPTPKKGEAAPRRRASSRVTAAVEFALWQALC